MKKVFRKLKEEQGEVSVEWALVAVLMAVLIAMVFMPGIKTGMTDAMTTINEQLQTAADTGP